MKKVSLIFLISIYFLSTLGIGVQQFFCCGKLKSTTISFRQEVKERCSNDNTMSAGCCDTKFTSLKVKDSHVPADAINTDFKYSTDSHLFTPSFEVMTLAYKQMVVANTSHAPPLHHGNPIYILHCTYRL